MCFFFNLCCRFLICVVFFFNLRFLFCLCLTLPGHLTECHLPFSQDEAELSYTGMKTMINISENGNCSIPGRFSLGD